MLAVGFVKRCNFRTLVVLQELLSLRAHINALEHEVKDIKGGMFEMQSGKCWMKGKIIRKSIGIRLSCSQQDIM